MTSAGRGARAARRGVWSIALLARVLSRRERNNFEFNRGIDPGEQRFDLRKHGIRDQVLTARVALRDRKVFQDDGISFVSLPRLEIGFPVLGVGPVRRHNSHVVAVHVRREEHVLELSTRRQE